MKRRDCLLLLAGFLKFSGSVARADDQHLNHTGPSARRSSPMSEESVMRDLFDRWERVWHEGRYDLVPSCVAENYIRHDEKGDRTVTRDAYAAEIAAMRQERPGIRVVVYDHSFAGDRAWFRFAFKWPDQKTGSREVGQACSPTASRAASSQRLGLCSSHSARHGQMPLRKSTGRARRQRGNGECTKRPASVGGTINPAAPRWP
jgi:hypothetical protein